MTVTIADLVTRVLVKPMDGAFRNPRFRWSEKQTLLLFVKTSDGRVGVGEAWSDLGAPDSIVAFIEKDLKPQVVGEDADLVEGLFRRMADRAIVSTRHSQTYAALSALDIALWDLKAQRVGLPLWRLLGGNHPKVLPYASGGLYRDGQTPAEFGEEYAVFARRGFRAVKIKVGGASRAADVARVAALRAACGPDTMLMVDAVSAYDVPQAVAFAHAVRHLDLAWFEQPVATSDVEGMARVHRDGGIPLCGNENDRGLHVFRRLIETDAVHFVQFDPVISGGITEGRKIAALAEARRLPVTLHHSNSVVSMLANLHLAAALPNCHSVELHVIHQPLFERGPADFLALDGEGRVTAPERPGLGVDLADLIA